MTLVRSYTKPVLLKSGDLLDDVRFFMRNVFRQVSEGHNPATLFDRLASLACVSERGARVEQLQDFAQTEGLGPVSSEMAACFQGVSATLLTHYAPPQGLRAQQAAQSLEMKKATAIFFVLPQARAGFAAEGAVMVADMFSHHLSEEGELFHPTVKPITLALEQDNGNPRWQMVRALSVCR